MDIKQVISELHKITTINSNLQNKLGELTLQITQSEILINSSRENILILMKILQNFLCHNYYTNYINFKATRQNNLQKFNMINPNLAEDLNESNKSTQQLSIYDNCMNLILLISAKISSLDSSMCRKMIDNFVEHVNNHLECFNYFISFHRLYTNCTNVKRVGKEFGLYSHLFNFYHKIYNISFQYESVAYKHQMKDIKSLKQDLNFDSVNSSNRKYLLENFKSNSKDINKIKDNSDSNRNEHLESQNILDKKAITKTQDNQGNKFSLYNSFRNTNSKSDRKNIVSAQELKRKDNSKEKKIELKRKIPELKFPIDIMKDYVAYARSSTRADFSKSGGRTTSHTKVNVEPPIFGQNRKEIIIDNSCSANRPNAQDSNYNALNKVKALAIQLGESCLAADLPSLINHKRDFELNKIARETVSKTNITSINLKYNPEKEYINSMKNAYKIETEREAFYDKYVDKSLDSDYYSQNEIKKGSEIQFEDNLRCPLSEKIYKDYIKIREVLANFLSACLKEYSIEEYKYLNLNVNLVYSYLMLPSSDTGRTKREKKNLESLELTEDFPDDFNYLIADGSYFIKDQIDEALQEVDLNSKEKSKHGIYKKDNSILKNKNINFQSEDNPAVTSFVSINVEEEKSSLVSFKSEFICLYEILSINAAYVEYSMKQQNFYKSIFMSADNQDPTKNEMWANGILLRNFKNVKINQARKHLDVFIDRVKNKMIFIISNINILSNNHSWNCLSQQMDMLSDYVKFCKSSVTCTHLMFEFNEIFIILKKVLIEIFSKRGPFEFYKSELKLIEITDYTEYKIPLELLELFTSYLNLLSKIIINSQLFTSDKFLNEAFINCPCLLELIKFLFFYLFRKELMDVTEPDTKNPTNRIFSSSTRDRNCSSKMTVLSFIKDSDKLITQHNLNENENLSNELNKISQSYKRHLKHITIIINYLLSCNSFFHRIICKEQLIKLEDKDSSKYWITSIRDYLRCIYMFVNSKNGILYEYISAYGSYIQIGNQAAPDELNDPGEDKEDIVNPVGSYSFIRTLLNFQKSIFEFTNKFSAVVNEDTSLDFIRVHYISFIKLYNKNLNFSTVLGDVNKILKNIGQKEKKKKIKVLIQHIYKDQNNQQIIINLCKLHLKCLFSLAKNRNVDVTNKFFQLRIVDFLIKELDLEHVAAENLYRAKNHKIKFQNDEEKDRLSNDQRTVNINKEDSSIETKKFDGFKLNLNSSEQDNKSSLAGIKNKYLSKQDSVIEDREDNSSKHYAVEDKNSKFSSDDDIVITKLNADEIGKDKSNNIEIKENRQSKSENSLEEDCSYNEDDDSDYSDIMLVDIKPKVNPYENKIPKLTLIPTTLYSRGPEENAKPQIKPLFNKLNLNAMSNNKQPCENTGDIYKDIIKDKVKENESNSNINGNKEEIEINNTNDEGFRNEPASNIKNCLMPQTTVNLSTLNYDGSKIIPAKNYISKTLKNNMDISDASSSLKLSIQNKNSTNPLSFIKKLNLKTIENKSKEQPESKDVINYAGNPGEKKGSSKNTDKISSRIENSKKYKAEDLSLNINNNSSGSVNSHIIEKEYHKSHENILNLQEAIPNKETTKIQIAFQNMLKKKYNLFYRKATNGDIKPEDLSNINLFYMKERNNRLLYHDIELQVMMISLIMCLIITPTRGTLDELYSSYLPTFESNKINILFLLHHHINHIENQEVLPALFKYSSQINPLGAGQRLTKILSINLFDTTQYKTWTKIAFGAYGKVFECTTDLPDQSTVAIKKMPVAESIYDFCHVFDIYNEITALEAFRMEGCITHLYDYGVDNDYYYIVMKKYQLSLKEWRNKQTDSLSEMLPIYLKIYKDILKAINTIHSYKTTHYDIKCDNIMIDYEGNESGSENQESRNSIIIRIADFGESKMFVSENDEYCVRSRGTDVIKSPEMLQNHGFNVNKEDDKFDRRKKMGTTRSSDIWSLGCLFYELLTGKFLFEEIEADYFGFMYKANTHKIVDLLTDDKLKELNNNPYLIDFLKFSLVKDQNYRPNIESIINRFQHVHALLVGSVSNQNKLMDSLLSMRDDKSFEKSLDACYNLVKSNNSNSCNSLRIKNIRIRHIPKIIKITEEIYLAEYNYTENNFQKVLDLGVTHVVSWTKTRNKESEKIFFLNLLESTNEQNKSEFHFIFKLIDFMRHCMIYRGILLFIDDNQYLSIKNKPNFLIRSLILVAVSKILELSAYDALTYINSKLLFFSIPSEKLSLLSSWSMHQRIVTNYIHTFPVVRCFCGACMLVLKRSYANFDHLDIKSCSCSKSFNNTEYSECPSNGCYDYIKDIKDSYGPSYESLQWGMLSSDDFLVGPQDNLNFKLKNISSNSNEYKKIILVSRGLEENLIQHSENEKRSVKLASKKYVWSLYKCRICQVWMFAEGNDRYQILINNLYDYQKKTDQKMRLIKSAQLKDLKLTKLL